jgi:type II secretion system protein J
MRLRGTERRSWTGAAGFTLFELMISTALMSLILGGAYICLRAGIASQQTVEARNEALQTARVAMARLSADLRCACPLSKDYDFVGMQRTLGEMRADNLDFATHNYTPQRPREADWCEVSYFLDKDRETGKFSLWRRRDPTPDQEPFAGGTREEIARGVRGLKFAYYDGFEWYDEWGDPQGRNKAQTSNKERFNLSGWPEAVRVTLSIDCSTKRGSLVDTAAADRPEPPLVFETIVRVNLADLADSSSTTGSSTNSPTSNAAPAADGATPPPPGGVR